MQDKVCFVIPVHPPYYKYLDFLNSIERHDDFDIVFILSFHEDYELLKSLNLNKIYDVLVLEDYFSKEYVSKIIKNQVIVTFKKWFGLDKNKEKYKYIVTIDSEIWFINTDNVFERIDKWFTEKRILGGVVTDPKFTLREVAYRINYESSSVMKKEEQDIIRNATHNFQYFFFASEPSIYESTTAAEFLKHISYSDSDEFTSKLTWHVFDYIPYIYYLFLYHNLKFININEYNIPRGWSLESCPISTFIQVKNKLNYRPIWAIQNTYLENKEIVEKDALIIYHRNAPAYNFRGDT